MANKYSTESIIAALAATNGMIYLAAEKLGCAVNTIYSRAKRVQAVQEAIDFHRGQLLDIGELRLRRAVLEGEHWAIAFLLRTLGRRRGYAERHEVVTLDLAQLSDEQLEALAHGEDIHNVLAGSGPGRAGTP